LIFLDCSEEMEVSGPAQLSSGGPHCADPGAGVSKIPGRPWAKQVLMACGGQKKLSIGELVAIVGPRPKKKRALCGTSAPDPYARIARQLSRKKGEGATLWAPSKGRRRHEDN